jgi:uncharacterized delta-60 repeat protein
LYFDNVAVIRLLYKSIHFQNKNMFKDSRFIIFSFILLLGVYQPSDIFAADGDLDMTFNGTGYVQYFRTVSFSGTSYLGPATVVQADGKIVVAYDGLTSPGGSTDAFITTRYNADGTLDATFGIGGTVKTNFGLWETLRQVLLQPDGKILLIGARFANGNTAHDFAVVRYNANGTLDTTFNNSGGVAININGSANDYANSAVVQPDGKIVLAGLSDPSSSFNSPDIAFARINQDGTLDGSFGAGGIALIGSTETSESVSSIALQSNGKIVAAGYRTNGSNNQILMLRLNSNGTLDEDFRSGGLFTIDLSNVSESAKFVLLQSDGKILIGGSANTGVASEFALLRFLNDGSADPSFDGDGVVFTSFPPDSGGFINSMVLQNNGKIVAAGGSNGKFAVARFNSNGSLDASFGSGGRITSAFRSGIRITSAALQPDGKLVVAGETNTSFTNGNWVIAARYQLSITNNRRTTVFDFDGDGKSDISVFRPINGSWYMNSSTAGFAGQQFGQPNDKLVPADYDGDGKTDIAVFRDGNWYISQSSNNAFRAVQFGLSGDVPVPGDYDGDGKADVAVFRQGNWYFLNSTNNQFRAVQFGLASDKPVPSDFDGDNKTDVAVFREGFWYWLDSTTNQFKAIHFGTAGDKPVAADYDGDGKADQAVFRGGAWYLNRSTAGFTGIQFGTASDVPTPADYDGDEKADISVFRDGNWYRLNSGNSQFFAEQFGTQTDKPVPAAFIP